MTASATEIREFDLEVKLSDGSEQEYDYKRKNGKVAAKVKIRDKDGSKMKQTDQDAISATERLLSQLAPSPDMSGEQLVSRALSTLHVSPEMIDRLEIEVEFADGTGIEAKA